MGRVKRTAPTGPVSILYDGKLVHGTWKAGTVRFADGALIAANVERAAEGRCWVRGHVAEDDPAWRALLTVNALREQVPDLKENSRRYMDNEIDVAEWRRNVDLWYEADLDRRRFPAAERRRSPTRTVPRLAHRHRLHRWRERTALMAKITKIRDEEFVQEADITFDDVNVEEAKTAFAFIAKLRTAAMDKAGVDESEDEEDGTTVTQVDYRIEDGAVVVHVMQGLVD